MRMMYMHKIVLLIGSAMIAGVLLVVTIISITRDLSAQVPARIEPVPTSTPGTQSIATEPLYDVVVAVSPSGQGGAALSQDGNLVAYAGADGLHVHNLTTSQSRLLLDQVDQIGSLDVIANPAFSPDGSHIVFSASGDTWYYPADIYSIGVDGIALTKLTTSTLPGKDGHYAEMFEKPMYSPDGSEVALTIYDVESGNYYVGVAQPGAGEPRRLVEGQPLFWAVDGKGIYYSNSQNTNLQGSVELLNLQTKTSQPVLNTTSYFGTVAGLDAVFVATTSYISTASLSGGASIPAGLAKVLGVVSLTDNQGRALMSVQEAGGGHLLLVYSNILSGEHLEVLRY
jgi:hypothetical protein